MPRYTSGPGSQASRAAQADQVHRRSVMPSPATATIKNTRQLNERVFSSPVRAATPPTRGQQTIARSIGRATARGRQGQAPTTMADVQRFGFQGASALDTGVRSDVAAQKRQQKLDGLINKAAMGAHPSQFMPQMKAMKLTPAEKAYAASETGRRGNINIAAADPFGQGLANAASSFMVHHNAIAEGLNILHHGPAGAAENLRGEVKTMSGIDPYHPLSGHVLGTRGGAALALNAALLVPDAAARIVGRGVVAGTRVVRAAQAARATEAGAISRVTAKSLREAALPGAVGAVDLSKGPVDKATYAAVKSALKGTNLQVFREHGIDPKVLARAIKVGEPGRYWYEDSAKEMLRLAGGDKQLADKYAQLVSVYSSQREPIPNIQLATNAIREYQAGRPISVGTAVQANKANAIMRGEGFQGLKTDRFYKNHLEEIDPAKYKKLFGGAESTHDIWMARLFGLKTDAPTPREYSAMESTLKQIGDKTGWKPKQIQAAMWIAKKAHDEGTSIAEAGLSFADALRHESGVVPFEAAPGRVAEPALYERYAALTPAKQVAYTRQKAQLLNQFFRETGILGRLGNEGPGVFEGQVNPGWSAYVAASRGKGPAMALKVTNESRAALDYVASAIGHAFNQDAAAWFKPFYRTNVAKKDANGLLLNLGHTINADEAKALDGAFRATGQDIAIVHSPEGAYLLNFSKLSNPEFHNVVADTLSRVMPGDHELGTFAFDGNYIERGSYADHLQATTAGSPDLLGRAVTRLQERSAALDVRYLSRQPGAVGRAARAVGGTGADALSMGLPFGRNVAAEGEHGLIPAALSRLRGGARAAEVAPEVEGAVHGPQTLGQAAGEAVQEAKPVRAAQERGYTAERGKRIAAQEERYHLAGGGIEGHLRARQELAGELPKLHFSGMEHLGGTAEADALVRKIYASPQLDRWQRNTAAQALLDGIHGKPPTNSEIAQLEKVFPPADVAKLVDHSKAEESKLKSLMSDILQIPRTMQSSADVSALMRQALPVLTRHPGLWSKSLGPSFAATLTRGEGVKGALFSETAFKDFMQKMVDDPAYQQFKDAGGQITDVGHHRFQGGQNVEEAFGSGLAEKLPVIGHSARQYTAFLDDLRLRMWKHLLPKTEALATKQALKKGLGPQETEQALTKAHKDLARYVNTMTGRGPLPGKMNMAAPFLNGLFFSPRLLASRIDLLMSPVSYMRATPYVRRQAVRSMLQTAGVGTAVLYA